MKTTKPISTISFNTRAFLEVTLERLTKAGVVSYWAFVTHEPEDDEGGKKKHHHVYIEPSRLIQTDDLRKEFREPDLSKPDKPLGCLTFTTSKFAPWYMYAIHDRRYLACKGEARQYHYAYEDVATADEDDLLFKVRTIDLTSLSPYADMLDAIDRGISFTEYFNRGTIPLPQINNFQRAWGLLLSTKAERERNFDHPIDYVDPITGEVADGGEMLTLTSDEVLT